MNPKGAPQAQARLQPLTPTEEEILKIMSTYRYMTALDVAYSIGRPKSVTHVRSALSRLAGGMDNKERECLYRFPFPSGRAGNPERIFTLGSAGRDIVESLGIPVDWYYRPSKTGRFSGSYLSHQLLLTRFVLSACHFTSHNPDNNLAEVRLCYELEKQVGKHGADTVVPDAWLFFEREGNKFPVLAELDRGTEYQERFKNHVKGRLAFIRSGNYARVFGTPAVIIAYATTGQVQGYAETRRKTMCAWTMEVLAELAIENWAGIFRFTSAVEYKRLFEQAHALFDTPVWCRPDAPSTPVHLLGS
jgi:hypothetical protein